MAKLTDKGLGRIIKSVESFERQALFHSTPQYPRGLQPACVIRHAIVTATIAAATAGTPNTPGAGTVTLYTFDGSSYSSLETGITAWNDATGSIAIGTQIKVCLQDGLWFVIWYLC